MSAIVTMFLVTREDSVCWRSLITVTLKLRKDTEIVRVLAHGAQHLSRASICFWLRFPGSQQTGTAEEKLRRSRPMQSSQRLIAQQTKATTPLHWLILQTGLSLTATKIKFRTESKDFFNEISKYVNSQLWTHLLLWFT